MIHCPWFILSPAYGLRPHKIPLSPDTAGPGPPLWDLLPPIHFQGNGGCRLPSTTTLPQLCSPGLRIKLPGPAPVPGTRLAVPGQSEETLVSRVTAGNCWHSCWLTPVALRVSEFEGGGSWRVGACHQGSGCQGAGPGLRGRSESRFSLTHVGGGKRNS